MSLKLLLKSLTVDPVNLSIKEKSFSFIACFFVIFIIALLARSIIDDPSYPIIVASMGASAVILFMIPNSPLAQPWPFVGGQMLSAVIGIACALNFDETIVAATSATSGSIFAMLLLRCLHPPGAATALAPVMAGDSITSLGYQFVLMPVGLNVLTMLVLAILINRVLMKRNYPVITTITTTVSTQTYSPKNIGISEADLEVAIKNSDSFIDVTAVELSKLLIRAELRSFERIRADIYCQDIMTTPINSVEYGTEVESAWQIIYSKKLKALPVVDSYQRVIGILTQGDFFKYINLNAYDSIQKQFREFIQRSTGLTTSKPEAVGHIMTNSPEVLLKTDHIVELIPLMLTKQHQQIPIIDEEHRLVGMVYQADLIAALYHIKLSS